MIQVKFRSHRRRRVEREVDVATGEVDDAEHGSRGGARRSDVPRDEKAIVDDDAALDVSCERKYCIRVRIRNAVGARTRFGVVPMTGGRDLEMTAFENELFAARHATDENLKSVGRGEKGEAVAGVLDRFAPLPPPSVRRLRANQLAAIDIDVAILQEVSELLGTDVARNVSDVDFGSRSSRRSHS